MKSKKSQLMLLVGALTVSFAAQAAVVQDGTRSENPIEETDKATDANLFGHVVDTKTGEHLPTSPSNSKVPPLVPPPTIPATIF